MLNEQETFVIFCILIKLQKFRVTNVCYIASCAISKYMPLSITIVMMAINFICYR